MRQPPFPKAHVCSQITRSLLILIVAMYFLLICHFFFPPPFWGQPQRQCRIFFKFFHENSFLCWGSGAGCSSPCLMHMFLQPASLWRVHPHENWGPVLSSVCLPCTAPKILFTWKTEWHPGPSTQALLGKHIYITETWSWATLAGAEGSRTVKSRGRTAVVFVSSTLNNIIPCPQLFHLSAV